MFEPHHAGFSTLLSLTTRWQCCSILSYSFSSIRSIKPHRDCFYDNHRGVGKKTVTLKIPHVKVNYSLNHTLLEHCCWGKKRNAAQDFLFYVFTWPFWVSRNKIFLFSSSVLYFYFSVLIRFLLFVSSSSTPSSLGGRCLSRFWLSCPSSLCSCIK